MANYTDVRDEELESIRNDFYYKYKDQIDRSEYHKDDLQRLKKDTSWLRAFYKHGFNNHDKTVSLIHDVLAWRKDFDANSLLTPGKYPVPEDIFTRGGIFPRNEDINCNPMLHFVVKIHKKDQYPHNQICKFIAFFFEKAYKFNVDDPIVLMFDMSDAGYSNLDMDMIKFVVSCLKTYYPGLIDYMIVFQMPFIFNAAWKIIKNWLPPEAIKLIKFVDKKSVKEFVQESQLFVHMGGTDTYKFTYDPKMFMVPLPTISTVNLTVSPKPNSNAIATTNNHSSNQNGNIVITNQLNVTKREPEMATTPKHTRPMLTASNSESLIQLDKKKQTPLTSNLSVDSFALNANKNNSEQEPQLKNGINGTPKHQINGLVNRNVHRQASELTFGNVLTAPLLSINPGDELIFNTSDAKSDIVQYLKLTNTSDAILAYKIKITSPDKFRVKPGTGIIQPSTCVQIMISFLKDFHTSSNTNRDKFLILWTPVDEQVQASEINDFWKQTALKKVNIQEHKVKCVVLRPSEISKNIRNETTENGQSASSSDMLTSNELSRALSAQTSYSSQKSKTDLVVDSSNAAHVKKLSKLLGESRIAAIDEQNISNGEPNRDQLIINRKLYDLDSNMNKVLNNQQKIIKQHSIIIFLIYFLILINLIQVLFQSNLFSQVIEPYIDYYLFQKTE